MNTSFGFDWGPLSVTRVAHFKPTKSQTGHRVITVSTEEGESIDVYVSEKGRSIRVWKNLKELK